MDQRQIPIEVKETTSMPGFHKKEENLMASEQLTPGQEESLGKKKEAMFELRKEVKTGNVGSLERKLASSDIFNQVTPAGDSLLHEAAYWGNEKIARLIGQHFPYLLVTQNIDGDTPLHIAARLKHSSVIDAILSQKSSNSSTKEEKITQLTNNYGNTALHESVCSKHVEGVKLLLKEDNSAVHQLNKSGESALYLAVLTSDSQIINALLDIPFPDEKRHGISPLHAAIKAEKAGKTT